MAKKFNGHRCERRNLTDLVLGTGPTGKKRAKPKAKKRPKNFFEPGGPTGAVQDNTRVNMPAPPPELQGPQGIYSLPQITRHPDELVGPRQDDFAYLSPYMQGIVEGEIESAMQHGGIEDARRQYNFMRAHNPYGDKEYNVLPEYRGRPGPNEERPFFTGFDEYYQPEVYATPEMDVRQAFSGLYREAGSEMDRGNVDAYRFHRLIPMDTGNYSPNAPHIQYPHLRDQDRRRMYGGPSGGGGGEADPPEEPGEGRRRSAVPLLYTGSPTANVLDMLSNYDRSKYTFPEGMNPAGAIGKMALTSAYNQLPIDWMIDNTSLPMDQAVMKYNAEQRAAQQPTGQQQPLDSVGGDLSFDYYVIDGETVALPAGSPPPMGAAVVESAPQTTAGAPQTNVNTGTYNANTTFSGTPLQIGDNAAATASFGDGRLAPELAGSGLATDAFNSMSLLQHGVSPNTPATSSEVAFGAPYAAPGNYAMGPRNELADEPYDFMNFGAQQGMRNAFMPAGSSTTFDQDSPTGGVNMEAINRAVMRQPFGLQPGGLQGGLNSDLPDFKGMADAAKQKFDAFKATSGFGQKPQGDPSLMAQLGSQEGRANIVNQFLKPGGTGMKDLTQSTGMFANAAKGGVNMLTDKIASTMEGDDGFFAAGMGGAMRAGIGALMMGSPAALPIAAVGAIGGIVKRKREMDLANAMDNANNLKTVEAVQGDLADYNTQVNSVMNERGQGYRFGRYGGPMGQADYETEGGEMMMASPNDPPMAMGQGQYDHQVGNMYKVRGPKHEQGGVPTAGAMQPYIDEFGQRQDSPYVYSDAKEFRIDPTPFLKMLR